MLQLAPQWSTHEFDVAQTEAVVAQPDLARQEDDGVGVRDRPLP